MILPNFSVSLRRRSVSSTKRGLVGMRGYAGVEHLNAQQSFKLAAFVLLCLTRFY